MKVIQKMKGLKKLLPSAADFHYHSQRFGIDLPEEAKPYFDNLKYGIEMFLIESETESRLIQVLDLVEKTKDVGIYDSVPILAEIVKYMRVQLLSTDPDTVYNTMVLADTMMKNCGYRIHILFGRRIFMKTFGLVTRRHREGAKVKTADHYKVFTLGIDCIQAWGEAFISRSALYPHIYETYHKMRYKYHIPFPRVDFDPTRVPIFLGPITTKETQLVHQFPEVEDRDAMSSHHTTGDAQHSDDEVDGHLMDSHAHGYDSYEDAGHTNYDTLNPAPEEIEAARLAAKYVESSETASRTGTDKHLWRIDDYSTLQNDGHHRIVSAPIKPEPVRPTKSSSTVRIDPFAPQAADSSMSFEVSLSPAKPYDLIHMDSPIPTSSSSQSSQSFGFASESVDLFEPCTDADLWWVVSKSSKSNKRARRAEPEPKAVKAAPVPVPAPVLAQTHNAQAEMSFSPTKSPQYTPPPPPPPESLLVEIGEQSAAASDVFSESSPVGAVLVVKKPLEEEEQVNTEMIAAPQPVVEPTYPASSESALVPFGTTYLKPTVAKTYTPEQFNANTVYRDTKSKPQLHAFSDIENSVAEMMKAAASTRSAGVKPKPPPPVATPVTPLVVESKKVAQPSAPIVASTTAPATKPNAKPPVRKTRPPNAPGAVQRRKAVPPPATLDEFISYITIDSVPPSRHLDGTMDLQMAIDVECNELDSIPAVSEPEYHIAASAGSGKSTKRNSKRVRAVSAEDVNQQASPEKGSAMDTSSPTKDGVSNVSPTTDTASTTFASVSTDIDTTASVILEPHAHHMEMSHHDAFTTSEAPPPLTRRVDTPQPTAVHTAVPERTGTYYLNQQRIKKHKALERQQFHGPSVDHSVDIKFFGVQRVVSKHGAAEFEM